MYLLQLVVLLEKKRKKKTGHLLYNVARTTNVSCRFIDKIYYSVYAENFKERENSNFENVHGILILYSLE